MEVKEGSILTVVSSAGGDFYTKETLEYVGEQKTKPCIVIKNYNNGYVKVCFASSTIKETSYLVKNKNEELWVDANKTEIVKIKSIKKNIGYLSKNSQLFKNIKFRSKLYFRNHLNKRELEKQLLSPEFLNFSKRKRKSLLKTQFIGVDKISRNNLILKEWRRELKNCNKDTETIKKINEKYKILNKDFIKKFKKKTSKKLILNKNAKLPPLPEKNNAKDKIKSK